MPDNKANWNTDKAIAVHNALNGRSDAKQAGAPDTVSVDMTPTTAEDFGQKLREGLEASSTIMGGYDDDDDK